MKGAPPRVYLLRELFFILKYAREVVSGKFAVYIRERRTYMIIVNGKEINLTEDTTVAEYLEQNQYQVKESL